MTCRTTINMAWRNGYYYQNERRGGRVVTRYFGAGDLAEQAAADVEARKDARRRLAAQRKAERADVAAVDDEYNQLRDLVHAQLLAAGMHQHKREWRRYRGR